MLVLCNVQWLPIALTIQSQTLLTHKTLQDLPPQQISNMLSVYKPSRPQATMCLYSKPPKQFHVRMR